MGDIVKAEAMDVQALIAQAIDKGTSVDVLERLMALAEKWKAARARDDYFAALAAFQAWCPIIAKTKQVTDRNGKPRYKYAPLDDIVSQVKEGLKANGFSYTIDTEQPEGKLVAFCDSHHIGGHSERTRLEVPVGSDYMTAQQMVGAARTYAMRYVFCNAFGILTGDEDNDATTTEGDGAPERPAQEPDGTPANPFECPSCHKHAVIKGAPQYGGGWVCWKKKEGCGAKWDDAAWAAAKAVAAGGNLPVDDDFLEADAEPISGTVEDAPDPAEAQGELADTLSRKELVARITSAILQAGDGVSEGDRARWKDNIKAAKDNVGLMVVLRDVEKTIKYNAARAVEAKQGGLF